MKPVNDPERSKARGCDETSSVAAPPSEAGDPFIPPHLRTNQVQQQNIPPRLRTPPQPRGSTRPSSAPTSNTTFRRPAQSTNQTTRRGSHATGRQGGLGRKRHFVDPGLKSRTDWADRTLLVKERDANEIAKAAKIKEVTDKYVNAPDLRAFFPTTLYYTGGRRTQLTALLGGVDLPALNEIKIARMVHIVWDADTNCIKILSENPDDDEIVMPSVLQDIKAAIKHSIAAEDHKTPLYIVVPPSANAMKLIVEPITSGTKEGNMVLYGTRLAGEPLSMAQKASWSSRYSQLLAKNCTDLEKRLIADTKILRNHTPWMRMRVHFGHIYLTQFLKDFATSKFGFEDYVKMMRSSRVAGSLDRRFDGSFATKIMNMILDYPKTNPEMFMPFHSRIFDLKDVEPRHIEIIFIQPENGQKLRLEAEIDYLSEVDTKQNMFEAGTATGQYQIGATKLFNDDRGNGRVEITMVNIESGFDWVMEIIEDSQNSDLSPSMISLVNRSVSGQTKSRKDALGLIYPGVEPNLTSRPLGPSITEMGVKSTYSYQFGRSGYAFDVVIDRTWLPRKVKDGSLRIVMTDQPRIQASISMYHQFWDDQTIALYNTNVRDWDAGLKWIFGEKADKGGISNFLENVAFLQELLAKVSSS